MFACWLIYIGSFSVVRTQQCNKNRNANLLLSRAADGSLSVLLLALMFAFMLATGANSAAAQNNHGAEEEPLSERQELDRAPDGEPGSTTPYPPPSPERQELDRAPDGEPGSTAPYPPPSPERQEYGGAPEDEPGSTAPYPPPSPERQEYGGAPEGEPGSITPYPPPSTEMQEEHAPESEPHGAAPSSND